MARISLLTLAITLLSYIHGDLTTAAAVSPATSFIMTSCRATTYPMVCVRSLWTYAATIQTNPRQLVTIALSVSMDRAQYTKTFLSKLVKARGLKAKEYAAIKDCLEEMNDSVDRLSKSVRELKSMGRARGPEYTWHMSNLQTWVSAALTDDNTCVDGFGGRAVNGRIKNSIRARMSNVAQVTSNALALCNRFDGKF